MLKRALILITAAAMLTTVTNAVLSVVSPGTAAAAATTVFDQPFTNNTASGTGAVFLPTSRIANLACLTAAGNNAGSLKSCAAPNDAAGSGVLRLTSNSANQLGAVFGATSIATTQGFSATFNAYQWGSATKGDGIAFVLAAADPAGPVPPPDVGEIGGALGYTSNALLSGVDNGYLGIGFDVGGSYSTSSNQGTGCTGPTFIGATHAGHVVVRGPGNGTVGYCGIQSTWSNIFSPTITLRAGTRPLSKVQVEVAVNPGASPMTTSSTLVVAAKSYVVSFTQAGGTTKQTLTRALPSASGILPASWLDANGFPKNITFGWTASTGTATDYHEIDTAKVETFAPSLGVSTTSYAAATSVAGSPITYVVTPSVLAGVSETKPISVVQTVPTGVVPLKATGTGWVCQAPVGQTISCTTTASSFAANTTLPVITVVAIATGSVTTATVQSSSPTTATSADASQGSSATTTAGTVPTAPTSVSVAPANGPIAGGTSVIVAFTSAVTPTAIEVGTTAELQAGTPVTLMQCPGSGAPGCFTISGSTAVISSVPARASPASVSFAVVTRGVATSATYVYTDKPSTPSAPTATAGLASAAVSWVPPATNGSPITRYIVTPSLGGVAQTALSYDQAATTRTVTGLTVGGSYTFTVAAVNAIGTSTASPASAAVIPYVALTAPAITAATAGDSRATLTWTAPVNSPVTGYTITPYISGVPQTPQTFSGAATTQTVTGLTPGTPYTFTVAAQNSLATNVLYRVNAAGPALAANDGGPGWAADDGASNPLRNNNSIAALTSEAVSVDATVPASTPAGIFDSERYDNGVKGDGAEMQWFFPVTAGATVKVRLYFINHYSGTSQVGQRIFDVAVEGVTVLNSFDIIAGAGASLTGTMREFSTTSDGTVTIDFIHEALDNPLINGIEIIQTGLPVTGPASAQSSPVTPNQSPSLTFAAPPAGEVGLAYSRQLIVNNGTTPFVWSLSSGALPAGLTLNPATGLLSGTPTANGTFALTVLVTDASAQTASKAVTLVIAAAQVLTFVPAAGEVSIGYSQQPTLTGGLAPQSWALTAGSLPAGLALNTSTGLISGTPTASGSFSISIAVTDALAQVVSKTVIVVILPLPTLTFTAPAPGQAAIAYSTSFVVTGGATPLTWSIAAGSLPAGLTLNTATGVLSGIPTTAGTYPFTVSVVDANSKTANKAVSLVIAAGPLVIVKTANVTSAVAGATVQYTIVLTNTGSTPFTGVAWSDTLAGVLDDAVYNANATATGGALSYSSSTLNWNGNIAGSSSVTVTYSVTVSDPDTGNKVLANTILASTLGTNCAAGTTDPRCTATVTVAGLTIVKTANVATAVPGSTVQFTVVVTNSGQTAYTGATFTDTLTGVLDDAVYNSNATATTGSTSYISPSLTWTGNLAVGASATIGYSVTISDPPAGDRSLTGTVVSPSAGSTCPGGNPAPSCSVTVTVLVPALSITNTIGTPAPQLLGRWTFDEGTGTTAADSAGSHPATLSGGAGWAAGIQGPFALSRDGTAGVADTGAAVLNTAASYTVSAWVKLNNVNGFQTVVSQDGTHVSGFYLELVDSGKFAFVRIAADSSGAATTRADALAAAVVGQWYRLTGVYDATAATQSLYINGQLQQTVAAPAGWGAAGNLVIGRGWWGDGPVDFVNGTIDDVQVHSGVVVPGGANPTPGDTVPLTLTIKNTGQTPYTATSVTLALPAALDDAVYNNNAVASSGTVVYDSALGTLVWTGNLATGAVVTITASMTVRDPDPGDTSMVTVASSAAAGSTCPTGSSNSACTATVQVLVPALTITKAADVSTTTPGSVVRYTVTVANTGQTDYPAATFSDPLAAILDDATYSNNAAATTGALSFSSSTLTWTGNLPIGATATITYPVTVKQPDPGNFTLSGTVTSGTPGSNCAAGSNDPRCTSSVPVLVPSLSISTTADAVTTTPGSVVRYTISAVNTGQTSYTSVPIAIDFFGVYDDAAYNNDATTTAGSLVTNANGTVQWVLSLAPGASASGTASFTVNSPASGDKTMTTVVSSDAPGSDCLTGSANAACRTATTVLIPKLTITKTANASTVVTGGTVDYTIQVANSGETAYPAATVNDSLAAVLTDAVYSGVASATTGSVTYAASTLSWTGALAVGATATITYSVTILDPDPGDKRISNTVVSTSAGSNCAAGSIDTRCTVDVTIVVPGLTILKTANAATTFPGAIVGYTITVTNSGATAYTGAAITDSLTAVLDDAVYNADVASSAGVASYANSTVSWAGDLAIGAAATITYTVTVHPAAGGNNLLTTTVLSTTKGNNCTAGSPDTRCTVVVPVARLIFTQSFTELSTTPGSLVHLTGTYTNTGQVPYTGISVSHPRVDILDDATPTGADVASFGTMTRSPTAITWTGDIPVGAAINIERMLTVNDPDTGNKNLTAKLVSTAPGNNCLAGSTDPLCTFSIPVLLPGLTITKTAAPPVAEPGTSVSYTLTIRNSGQTPYTAASVTDSLTGVLDDAVYNNNAAAIPGSVSFASSALTWTGDLALGATATVTYSVTVRSPDSGDKVMSSTISSAAAGSNCLPAGGNPACTNVVPVLTPSLTIVKTADQTAATLGSTVTYTVVVTNSGPTAYPAAAFSDSLAGVLDDATYNAGASDIGAVSVAGGVLSWSGALNSGEAAVISYSVIVKNPAAGDRSMSNTIVSAAAGNNCVTGSMDARCTATVTITNAVALTFTHSASVAETVGGAAVPYTVTVHNSSATSIAAVNFTVPLGEVLDDATYNDDAAATAGAVTFTNPNLTWLGTVPAGATITITYTVTVLTARTGDELLSATLTSTSQPTGDNCLSGSGDTRCSSTVRVAGLLIQQSYAETSTTPGSLIHLTATFTNTGQVAYQGITITSPSAGTVDDAVATGDQTATTGTLVLSASAITWTGNIPVGGTITVTGTLTVANPDLGDKLITGTLVSAAVGNNCPAGGTDPRCTALTTVKIPGLSITKTANTPATVPGGTVSYTITVTNSGQTAYTAATATAATVTDTLVGVLDDATYNGDAAVSGGGGVSFASPTLTWTGDLAVGATATITYSIAVRSPDTGDKTLINPVASSNVGSTCPPASGSPACRAVVAVLTPALTIVKTANPTNVTLGSTVAYTVTVTNSGQTSYPAATFTDPLAGVLDDAVYNNNAAASPGVVAFNAGVLTWTGALNPGNSATVTYSVTINNPSTGDRIMSNTITSSTTGSNCAAGSSDTRCTAQVTIVNSVTLTFQKTANALSTFGGAVVGYTVTVTNSSGAPIPAVDFTDPLAGVLDDATYRNDVAATSGSATFTNSNVMWTGTVLAGETITVTYSVDVNAAITGDQILSGTLTSPTLPESNNCVSGSLDPRCAATVPVARLLIAQSYPQPTTTPGSLVRLTATFTNTGKVPYHGITITSPSADTVDDAIATGDQTATTGTLELTASAIIWTGDIPIGGTVTVTGTLTVMNPDPGNKAITGTLVSTAPGNNCPSGGSDTQCTALITVLLPALTITKTADTTAVAPGGVVGYTITVHNTGQTSYTAASVSDTLVGVLDDASYNANATATGGALSFTSPVLTWTGDLAVNGTVTITYSVTTHSPGTGDKTMINPVSSVAVGSTCPPASGSAACRATVLVLTPALTIVKAADLATVTLGSTITYTVTVTNSGQTSYPAAAFSDSLAGVLDDAIFNPAATTETLGVTGYADGVLTWTGALTPGQAAIVTYTVTAKNPSTGDRSMSNTVTSADMGSNCGAGSSDTRCTTVAAVTNTVALIFTKTADVTSAEAGAVVTFTVTVRNTSTKEISADFTDPLAGVLDDATFTSAAASSGTVGFTIPNLSWTGIVPAGATITVTYSVTVRSPDTGNHLLAARLTSTAPATSNNCLAGSIDTRCALTVPVAELLITQVFSPLSTTPGSVVRLTGTFRNTGQSPYVGISIASGGVGGTGPDDLGDDAIPNGDQTATSGSMILGPAGLVWTGDIPVGGVVTLTGTITVRNPDPGNKTISSTAVSAAPGNNCQIGAGYLPCTASIPVNVPGLTITKTANTTSAAPGATVGYTITVTNSGETLYSAATVTDPLAGILDDATYDGNATATAGAVTLGSETLTWTGDLAVGAVATISYSATVRSPALGDKIMINTVSSTDVGSRCMPASGAAACQSIVLVLTPALTITSVASPASTVPGGIVTYTITATNTGQTPYAAADVTVSLDPILDEATYNADAAATSGGQPTLAGNALTWIGPLDLGAAATITYSATVKIPAGGDHRLQQTVTSISQGSNCAAGGTDPRCTTSVPVASLRIVNTANVSSAKPTDVVMYTVTFTNIGQVPYVGITLNDSLVAAVDDATYNGDATADSGNLVVVPNQGRVNWTGDIAVGAVITITGSVTVNNPDAGNKVLNTTVSTGAAATNCPDGGIDPLCTSTVTVLTPALTITKTADRTTTTPGSAVGYTITITNAGETPYTAASVSDPLDGILNDATYNNNAVPTAGSVAYAGTVLTWTGNLAIHDVVVITFTTQVRNPDLGGKTMLNTVISDELGSTCPTDGTAPACSTVVTDLIPALDIAITADSTTTTPGTAVGYTVTVRNTGQTEYLGAGVTTSLTGVVDDATYPGGATATLGAVAFTTPNLTWTGNLPVGATAVISYTVTVANPDAGNHLLTTSVGSPAPGSTCTLAAPCLHTVAVLTPGLAVSITTDMATATPGDVVEYTITVVNSGQTPYLNTVVSTDVTRALDDSAYDGFIEATTGVATFSAPNISWTGSLAVGASAVINFGMIVNKPDLGNRQLITTVVANAVGSTCVAGSSSPACTATVTVLIPALTIAISTDQLITTTTPGSVVGYQVLITNTGQTPYTGAVVRNALDTVLPESDYNNNASAATGVLTYGNSTLTWTGDLLVGGTVTITYTVTVHDPATGDNSMLNTVDSTVPGSSCLPGGGLPGCSVLVRVLIPALSITKTADRTTVVAAGVVTYTVTVTNTGETNYVPATFTDSLTAVLDDAAEPTTMVATVGAAEFSGTTLTWTGPLNTGATAVITYSVVTLFPATGDHTLTNSVKSGSAHASCKTGAEIGCTTAVSVLVPALLITKTADVTVLVAGGTAHYTITATNTGEADYPSANLYDSFFDALDHGIFGNDAVANIGTLSYPTNAIAWTGPLARGSTVIITYSMSVPVNNGGHGDLENAVTSTSTGSNCFAGNVDSRCIIVILIAAQTLTMTGLTPAFTLTGLPNTTVSADGAVTMTITTNSAGGYRVTVRAVAGTMTGTSGNPDSIPIGMLGVRESGTFTFTPLLLTPQTVHSQNTPSSPGGDAVSNDYQVQIPFVASDTYAGTLEYIATAQ